MKKRIVLSAIAALLVLTAMPVVAQHTGQTLTIGGLVPLRLDLTLTPTTIAQDLPLVGTAAVTPAVAELAINTNNTAGWELWVYSVNGSELVNGAGDTISYEVSFTGPGGLQGTIPAGAGLGGDGGGGVGTTGLLIGSDTVPNDAVDATGDLLIHYTQTETFRAGYYSDQLAVVLRAQ